jgi:hypothetical protein
VALGVAGQEPPRGAQGLLLPDAGEGVQEHAALGDPRAAPVRGHGPQAQGSGQVEEGLVGRFLLAPPMPLHVEEDLIAAEGGEDRGQAVGVGRMAQGLHPGQGHEPFGPGLRETQGSRSPCPFATPAFMSVISPHRFW